MAQRYKSLGPTFFDAANLCNRKGSEPWSLVKPLGAHVLVRGVRQTVVHTVKGLGIKIDLGWTTIVRPLQVLDALAKRLGVHRDDIQLDHFQHDGFKKAFIGLKFEASHMPARKQVIDSFTTVPICEYRFELTPKGEADPPARTVSVVEYFETVHKHKLPGYDAECNPCPRLCYPHLPGILVRRKDGSLNVFPLELAKFKEAQAANRKLSSEETANMIKETATKPPERAPLIEQMATTIESVANSDGSAVRALGGHVGTRLVQVPSARRLALPKLMGKHQREVKVEGSMSKGVRVDDRSFYMDHQLARPERVDSWMIVSCVEPNEIRDVSNGKGKGRAFSGGGTGSDGDESKAVIHKFAEKLSEACTQLGMSLGALGGVVFAAEDVEKDALEARLSLETRKFNRDRHRPLQLVVFIISDSRDYNEKRIKAPIDRWALTGGDDVPVLCVQVGKLISKLKDNTFFKLNARKMNGRLGGQNEYVRDMTDRGTIVFGADVHHAGGGSSMPSVAAISASMDSECTSFKTKLILQRESREEKLENLDQVVGDLLRTWIDKNDGKPQRIVFYRDGVSDSGFDVFCQPDIDAIKRACDELRIEPELIYLCVQKRNITVYTRTSRRRLLSAAAARSLTHCAVLPPRSHTVPCSHLACAAPLRARRERRVHIVRQRAAGHRRG
eukprot:7391723-Prymnesium_polylepis.2